MIENKLLKVTEDVYSACNAVEKIGFLLGTGVELVTPCENGTDFETSACYALYRQAQFELLINIVLDYVSSIKGTLEDVTTELESIRTKGNIVNNGK